MFRKDIQKSKVANWKTLVHDTRRWKELVDEFQNCIKSCRAIIIIIIIIIIIRRRRSMCY